MRKNRKNYAKTVAKEKLVSLVNMEGLFFRVKNFEISLSDRQLYYFRVLVIYGRKIFLCTPDFRIFVSLVKWKKFFSQKFSEIPRQKRCNFPIYMGGSINFFLKTLYFHSQMSNYSGITIFYEKNFA